MIFFTGCTHFHHKNIINLASRPFGSAEEMNEVLIERWNSTVKDDDIVYHLGDVSWKDPVEDLRKLNGKIFTIGGNHDKKERLLKAASAGITAGHTEYLELPKLTAPFVLFHYPIDDWNGRYRGSIHLHCHTHAPEFRNPNIPVVRAADNFSKGESAGSLPKNYPPEILCNRFNVGVDACDFRPVSLDQIIEESRCGT